MRSDFFGWVDFFFWSKCNFLIASVTFSKSRSQRDFYQDRTFLFFSAPFYLFRAHSLRSIPWRLWWLFKVLHQFWSYFFYFTRVLFLGQDFELFSLKIKIKISSFWAIFHHDSFLKTPTPFKKLRNTHTQPSKNSITPYNNKYN